MQDIMQLARNVYVPGNVMMIELKVLDLVVGGGRGLAVGGHGESKGRGFQGVVKRFRVAGGPASHGSMFHRRIGSIGMRQTPGRSWKNQRMPGHMGSKFRTVRAIAEAMVAGELDFDHLETLPADYPPRLRKTVLVTADELFRAAGHLLP